jgi:hypothetical protein
MAYGGRTRNENQCKTLNMLRRLGGCNRRCVNGLRTYHVRRQYVVSTSKDVLTSWLKDSDRDEIRERTPTSIWLSSMYSKAKNPPRTSCCLLNLRSGEYWYYSYDSVSVDRFVP